MILKSMSAADPTWCETCHEHHSLEQQHRASNELRPFPFLQPHVRVRFTTTAFLPKPCDGLAWTLYFVLDRPSVRTVIADVLSMEKTRWVEIISAPTMVGLWRKIIVATPPHLAKAFKRARIIASDARQVLILVMPGTYEARTALVVPHNTYVWGCAFEGSTVMPRLEFSLSGSPNGFKGGAPIDRENMSLTVPVSSMLSFVDVDGEVHRKQSFTPAAGASTGPYWWGRQNH